jgi:hypothetical protein
MNCSAWTGIFNVLVVQFSLSQTWNWWSPVLAMIFFGGFFLALNCQQFFSLRYFMTQSAEY